MEAKFMEKANKVLWRVKAQDELDLAALAISPDPFFNKSFALEAAPNYSI
jgi:hypothetical protein